jgi:hypothetical protein
MGNSSSDASHCPLENDGTEEICQSQIPKPELQRNISEASSKASEKLHDIKEHFREMENAQTVDEYAGNNTQDYGELVLLKNRLVQRLGDVDRLQFTEVDSVLTENLSSGKKEVLASRKQLNSYIEKLRERIIQLLDTINCTIEAKTKHALAAAQAALVTLQELEKEFWDMERAHTRHEEKLYACHDMEELVALKNDLAQGLGDIDRFQFSKVDGVQTANMESCAAEKEDVLARRKQLNSFVDILRVRMEQLLSMATCSIEENITSSSLSTARLNQQVITRRQTHSKPRKKKHSTSPASIHTNNKRKTESSCYSSSSAERKNSDDDDDDAVASKIPRTSSSSSASSAAEKAKLEAKQKIKERLDAKLQSPTYDRRNKR